MTWSARQYLSFESERTRPAQDLIAAIPAIDARSVVDIGCGPGNSTELLHARFPGATISALDSSPDMLAAARRRMPTVRFTQADIQSWDERGPFDVILANAVLQWVPDHRSVFPMLAGKLSKGGSLAVQMPDNLDEPAHRLMRDIAADGPWAGKIAEAAAKRSARHDAAWYFALMRPQCERVDVWRTVYHHPLAGGAPAIVEWFKGSGLRPFLDPLDDAERDAYLARYTQAVALEYPAQDDGVVLLPFPRLFVVATR